MNSQPAKVERPTKFLTILLQLDAFRFDYLSGFDTPFLSNLKTEGISGTLVPTFGFEPDAAYIAGLYPDQADGGVQFWCDPAGSPFWFVSYLPKCLNHLSRVPELVMRKLLTKAVRPFCKAPTFSMARVPFHLLWHFSFPMKFGMEHQDFCNTDTVFDLLRESGKGWLFHCSPNNKVDLKSVVRRAEMDLHPPQSFAFFHIGNLDRIGHQYGPHSPELKKELSKVDAGIKAIWQFAKERFDVVHFLVIGDHGMMEVEQTLNIGRVLENLSLKLGKDYLYFLDSTMARFWFFSNHAKKLVTKKLNEITEGHILTKEELDRYHLNYSHNRFGDIIFLADPGVLIFPNFYQNRSPVKGMHGYAPETPDQQSMLLIHSPRVQIPNRLESPVDMRRIFPTILDLLALPIPEGCKLQSLIE